MNVQNKLTDLEKELSFLYHVAQSVHSLEIDELLKEIVRLATQISKADSCLIYVLDKKSQMLILRASIYVLDKKSQMLILRASKNPHPDLMQKIHMKLGEGITGWVAKEKKPVVISTGAAKDTRFKYFRSLPEDKFEAFLSVPIVDKHGVCGVINVQHKKKHIPSQMEVNLLSAIGKLVGGAVENALLIEESLALKEALEVRKLIEKAKGILMKKKSLSEDEAYRVIQKESMNTRKNLKEVAEAIILSDKLELV
ncbi:GAF and ANTAR domain-containing protein [Candidatus Gottesmanbacteria bacterium]|nr:GAF and ANTAR domain-containing protein [Candidatus Gottesmanbacteria bacterium]